MFTFFEKNWNVQTNKASQHLILLLLPKHWSSSSHQDSEEKEFSSFVVQALEPAVCLVSLFVTYLLKFYATN